MKRIKETLNSPVARLILRGMLKALVIAIVASLVFAVYLVVWIGSPNINIDKDFLSALVVATGFIIVFSIPIALITVILVGILLKPNENRNQVSSRGFFFGILVSGLIAGISVQFVLGGFRYIGPLAMFFASIAGGLTGLWMAGDALRMFPSNSK